MHRSGRSEAGRDGADDAAASTPGRATRTAALGAARVQRVAATGAPATPAATGAPAATDAAAAGAGGLIVEDDAAPGPGQTTRTQFLNQLHPQVIEAATAELGPVWSATGCPYIERWFARNSATPAAQLEALARRYAGMAAPPHAAADYIAPILARLRAGIARWKAGEDVSGDAAAAGLGIGPVPPPTGPGAIQRKASGAASADAGSPAAIVGELGAGRALDAGPAGRLGGAMSDDFGDVRVHTDALAAAKASELGARAFTIGSHVAFAAGEYQPGTVAGDALLAHELAHVQQQRGAPLDTAQKAAEPEGPEGALEQEADSAAIGAIARLWGGGKQTAKKAQASLKSEVSLKRCGGGASTAPRHDVDAGTGTASPDAGAPAAAAGGVPTTHGADSHAGAAVPDADQQTWISTHLNPERVSTAPPPATTGTTGTPATPVVVEWDGLTTHPHHARNRRKLRRDMMHAMHAYLHSQIPTLRRLRAARRVPMTRAGTGALAGHDAGVQGIAALANDAVSASFGGDTTGAAMSSGERTSATAPLEATGPDRTLFDQNDLGDLREGMGLDNAGLARDAADWIGKSTPACQTILSDHNLSPEAAGEQATFWDHLLSDFLAEGRHRHHALLFQQFGLNTTSDGRVMLGTAADPAGFHGDRDAAERAQRWSLFVIALHETMHRRAHPAFATAETGQVMREGFCEMFSEVVGNTILPVLRAGGNEPMRMGVEGRDRPLDASFIPDHYTIAGEYQSFYDNAIAIRDGGGGHTGLGDAGVRAAYFQGHVELLGLTPAGGAATAPPTGTRTLPIPAGIGNVDQLATATGIARAQLVTDNPGIATTFPAAAVLTGCRIHVVVSSGSTVEDRATIAAQNGVSEADLVRANPGIAVDATTHQWAAINAGDRILIPVH